MRSAQRVSKGTRPESREDSGESGLADLLLTLWQGFWRGF